MSVNRRPATRTIKTILSLVSLALVALCFGFGTEASRLENAASRQRSETDNCASCHQKLDATLTSLYSRSIHAKRALNCAHCHGGEPAEATKELSHAASFVRKPSPTDIVAMCGKCHTSQLAVFKTGRHAIERRGKPSLECSQCHGAHAIGAPESNISLAYTCTGCHGLEYLPELPGEFKKMLALADDAGGAIRRLQGSGSRPPDDAVGRRREIRDRIGRIVHATDLQGGLEKIPEILKLGDEFQRSISTRQ